MKLDDVIFFAGLGAFASALIGAFGLSAGWW